jgi:GlcNAc-PI de-N-acetylase/NPCBM-associated, NEW3 domain of alpha-galactosidase
MKVSRLLAAAVAAAAALQWQAGAQQPVPQYRIPPLTDLAGAPAVALALRKLHTIGTVVHMTAHPDDENNAALALYARHFGARVALVTATRGDGGQNEIGTELFDALGVLRTEELLTAHRFDGAEQYFTRAVDFGYSFSQQETLEKWGRQEILGDFVRHLRALRPDVIVTMNPEGTGGGQHHQTSAVLATEAFRAAADPAQFPEQIREGLQPWQALKLYRPAGGFGGRGGRGGPGAAPGAPPGGRGQRGGGQPPAAPQDGTFATLDTNVYEPLLGCTIGEVGGVASGMHMCQGRVPMVAPPSATSARYRLFETTLPAPRPSAETTLFDGIDVSLAGLARYAGERPPQALVAALGAIALRVDAASRAFDSRGPAATVPDLVAALTGVRELIAQTGSMGLTDSAKYEIDHRLRLKESQLQDVIVLAQALRIDATANDGLVVRGQRVGVSVVVGNRGSGELGVAKVTLLGFDAPGTCAPGVATVSAPYACATEVATPADARLTDVYWQRPENAGRATFDADAPFGLPFRPSPFRARVEMDLAGSRIVRELPVQYRYEGPGLVGEKRMELNVVPTFSVSVSPQIVVVPRRPRSAATAAPAGRELRVTVVNGSKGPASATVRLKTPAGWRVTPPTASVSFTREDESTTTRFTVTPPVRATAGAHEISAEAVDAAGTSGDNPAAFGVGYQVIEYPHIQRRHKIVPASARFKVIDVSVPPALTVGYLMGVGDQVPAALQQLGARVTLVDGDEMAWGDLSRYDVIVTGVRAYERRADLRANNHRLLKYVENGGTAIVQYNRTEFNQAQYGPYPARTSSDRITDENAPVKILVPLHPVFSVPNKLDERDWQGWVQERGTYFLDQSRDAKYVDLVEMEDPFDFNKGPKRGAFVEARYGKGRWLYVGLGLWRQLPSGTDGAYRIFANLISLGKAPARPQPIAVER